MEMATEIPTMTKEEELAWIQESEKEITAMDVQAIEGTDAMLKVLAAPEVSDHGIYKFGNAEIRYRKYMTRQLRALLSKAKKTVPGTEDPIKAQDDLAFKALSLICLDDPYTNPVFWQIVDSRSPDGRVYKILMDLIKAIGGGEASVKAFR